MVEMKVVENEKGKLKVEINDNSTIVGMVNDQIWNQKGVDLSTFSMGHPYLGKPILLVKGKEPEKAVIEAAEKVSDSIKSLRKQLEKK